MEYALPNTPYNEYVLSPDWQVTTSQLVYRNGEYWLHLGLNRYVPAEHWAHRRDSEVPDAPDEDAVRVLGVDLNVTGYTAVTSAGGFHGNADHLNHRRQRYEALRADLQQTGSQSAYRRLQARRGHEAAWFDEYAHAVANSIIEDAFRTCATHVVFEDLRHIRDRISNEPKYQQWLFDRVQEYVEYKLEPYGVVVDTVDPEDTSKQCSHTECGHVSDRNRDGKTFRCEVCGRSWNADYNAARNVGLRYLREECTVPASQTCSSGKAARQLALMSGILCLGSTPTFERQDWMSTGKPTASAVSS